ncbi:melanoma-associated antigen E1-like [Thomomys bottae]
MPRGQKSKLHAREKRRQNRGNAQGSKGLEERAMTVTEPTPPSMSTAAESCSTLQGLEAPSITAHKGKCAVGSTPSSTIPTDVGISAAKSIATNDVSISALISATSTELCASVLPDMAPSNEGCSGVPPTDDNVSETESVGTVGIHMFETKSLTDSTSQGEEGTSLSDEDYSNKFSHLDHVSREVLMVEQLLLHKYNMKQFTTKEDMLSIISQNYTKDFHEIFKRASDHLSAVFAVEVREVNSDTYNLISKLRLPNNGRVRAGKGFPKTGLVMNVLAMILLKGNCATEEDIWKFLRLMHVYHGRKHYVFGEPKKLITQDLVRLNYLECRQASNSNPPCYEFRWGPQAHAETSKEEVLHFLYKINETAPTFFATLYEEVVKSEKDEIVSIEVREPSFITQASSVTSIPPPGVFSPLVEYEPEKMSPQKLSLVIMPRGQKSKHRSRAKRQLARIEKQILEDAQYIEGEEAESSSSPPVNEGAPSSSPSVCNSQQSQAEKSYESYNAGAGGGGSNVGAKGVDKGADEESSSASQELCPPQILCKDSFEWKTNRLMQYMLEKFKKNEYFTQADMQKLMKGKCKENFPEIFKKASEHLELIFGIEMRKSHPNSETYTLINKLRLSSDSSLSGRWKFPKTGLVMILLGVIFMRGNSASEEEIWEFLNSLGIYAGRKHLIFGEPRKLITKDLVQDGYLEHYRVPGSNPPSYEYMWGFRAYAETTKMKVLEVLAKITDTEPRSFPLLYEQALREEEERKAENAEVGYGKARVPSHARSHKSSHV